MTKDSEKTAERQLKGSERTAERHLKGSETQSLTRERRRPRWCAHRLQLCPRHAVGLGANPGPEDQCKGSVLAAKAVERRCKGGVFAAKAAER